MPTDETSGSSGQPDAAPAGEAEVEVSEDKLAVRVRTDLSGQDDSAVAAAIEARLQQLGIQPEQPVTGIQGWLQEQVDESGHVDAVLVEGTPPEQAKDGWIEWADEFFDDSFVVDPETGRADYRARKGRRSVNEGMLLATVHPPVPGTEGVDVFGAKVPVSKPQSAKIRVGPNVRADESAQTYYAEIDGRISWAGGTLSVQDVFTIDGDIGLESGNIRHKGAVLVAGDVLEGADVDVTGDFEVAGMVEPSEIHVKGNLTVGGGICGDEKRCIRCDGSVQAKFLLDTKVSAGGDVVVETEIVNCEVRTRGRVIISGGRIVGGKIFALGGIEAAVLGSDGAIPTLVAAGIDTVRETAVSEKKDALRTILPKKQKIDSTIEPLVPQLDSLPEETRKKVEKLLGFSRKMGEEIQLLEQTLVALKDDSDKEPVHSIQVHKMLYSDTAVELKRERRTFKGDLEGPLEIVFMKDTIKARRTD